MSEEKIGIAAASGASEDQADFVKIGVVGHVWKRSGSVSIDLLGGSLRVGDRIRIRGRGHDFEQVVESMEVDHVAREEGRPGQLVAIEVHGPAHESDEVYRVR